MISIRKIGVIGRTYRNLNRYRQILAVLLKYGFDDILELLRIDQYIEIGLQMLTRKRGDRLTRLSRAKRVRLAIEELGPTYIKMGQILSTRPDLVPVDFINELSILQDKVPSVSIRRGPANHPERDRKNRRGIVREFRIRTSGVGIHRSGSPGMPVQRRRGGGQDPTAGDSKDRGSGS